MQFGVDTHKATLAIAGVDALGRPIAEAEFANTPEGHRALLAWATAVSAERSFGIEGSGAWGYSLARMLLGAGERVLEVPARLADRQRRRMRGGGKSDAIDAVAIAQAAARHADTLPVLDAGWLDRDLQLLLGRYQQLRRRRTREVNRLQAELGRLRPGYQQRVGKLRSAVALRRALRELRGDHGVPARLARRQIHELQRLDAALKIARAELVAAVRESGTTLLGLRGVGPIVAAMILVESRHFTRGGGRDAFANYTGTAPIPAGSGRTNGRVRLNRGGNRRLNWALHQMALTQARWDPRAQLLLARKQHEGKTWTEAMRTLKRHLSNAVYHALQTDRRIGLLT